MSLGVAACSAASDALAAEAICSAGALPVANATIDVPQAQSRLKFIAWDLRLPGRSEAAEADCLLAALARLQVDKPSDWRARYALAARQWDFAAAKRLRQTSVGVKLFADRLPPLLATPAATPIDVAPIWRVDLATATLQEQAMTDAEPLRLAFFFSPHCNPCRRADQDIGASPKLSSIMAACGLWLAQIDHGTDIAALKRWSASHGDAPIWAIRDWVRYGVPAAPPGTPTFLLIRDGHVLDRLVGWPPEGNEAALLALIKAYDADGSCAPPLVARPVLEN